MNSDKRKLGSGAKNIPPQQPRARSGKASDGKSGDKGLGSQQENEGQVLISARNDFYRDGASILKKFCYFSCAFMVASVASTFYSASQKENNVYFAAKENGEVIQLVHLSQPNMSDAAVTNWLSKALVDTFDFRFNNVGPRLSESTNRWFTREGGNELMKALESGGNLQSVIEKQLFVNLTLDSSPILIDRAPMVVDYGNGNVQEYFAWKYEVPGTITYLTRTKTYVDKVFFKITVQRQSMIETPEGLGIAKIIMLVNR